MVLLRLGIGPNTVDVEGGELRKRWLAFLHKGVLGCEEVEGSLVCGGSGCSQVSEALLIEKRIFPEPADPVAMAELGMLTKNGESSGQHTSPQPGPGLLQIGLVLVWASRQDLGCAL